ncbi:MAG: DNA polymerase III subunit chi [Pseudomonadota bacterium]
MGELRFYHLTEVPLERALPVMLERTLERNQRAVVRGVEPERLSFINGKLWTYGDASFLPHGMEGEDDPADQPVWLTTAATTPNGAKTLFLIDGAETSADEIAAMDVTALLFDGHDQAAVEVAREQWKALTASGQKAVYWAQESDGSWAKKAESGG